MPAVLRVGPHRLFFFSNERDEPPHLHVERAENYAKFWLLPVTLASAVGYNAAELRRLRALVDESAEAFNKKWREPFRI